MGKAGVMQDGQVMTVGDAVELCMMPGDQAPRVARLQALWSQVAMDGRERMFAHCCLFYWPSVCLHTICLRVRAYDRQFVMLKLTALSYGAFPGNGSSPYSQVQSL